MTDKEKLQQLFEAALRDSSDFNGKSPTPASPPIKRAGDFPPVVPAATPFKPTPGSPAIVSRGFGP